MIKGASSVYSQARNVQHFAEIYSSSPPSTLKYKFQRTGRPLASLGKRRQFYFAICFISLCGFALPSVPSLDYEKRSRALAPVSLASFDGSIFRMVRPGRGCGMFLRGDHVRLADIKKKSVYRSKGTRSGSRSQGYVCLFSSGFCSSAATWPKRNAEGPDGGLNSDASRSARSCLCERKFTSALRPVRCFKNNR